MVSDPTDLTIADAADAVSRGEVSPIELTSAYSVFPNHGIRMVPFSVVSISDREGALLFTTDPRRGELRLRATGYAKP